MTERERGEQREKGKERNGGNASGGAVTREGGREGGRAESCTKEGGVGWREGGSTRARDGGWRGSGCLNSAETLRAFCMFAFVMIESWLAPCLLLIHEL